MPTPSNRTERSKPGRRGPSALELFCLLLLAGIAAAWGYSRWTARQEAAAAAAIPDRTAARRETPAAAKAAAKGGDIFAEAMRAEAEAEAAGQDRSLTRAAPGRTGGGGSEGRAAAAGGEGGSAAFESDGIGLRRTPKGEPAAAKRERDSGRAVETSEAGADGSGFAPAVERLRAAQASGESLANIRDSDVAKFKEPDIQESLKILENMPWGPETSRLFQNVISQWGKVNPSEAMNYAMTLDSNRTRNSAVASVLDSWARADPQAALSWYARQAQENPGSVAMATQSLFRNLARADASSALERTWSLQDAGLKRSALQAVVDTMTRAGQGDQLVGLHRSMTEGADRNMLADLLVASWTPYAPDRAASWAMNLDDTTARSRSLDRVVSSWSADRPSAAADWVASMPPGDLRAKEMGNVVQNWARDNVVEAANWLRRFPPSAELDPAIQSLSSTMAVNDPPAAMAWAQNVTDPRARQTAMTRVAMRWMERDPASAQQFIVGSGLPAPVIQKLLGQRPAR